MNYLETMKNIAKNKEKRVENIIFLIVLLVILLVAFNFIFKKDNNTNSTSGNANIVGNKENTSKENATNSTQTASQGQSQLEERLADILSQVSGISQVSVVLTYSQDTKQNVIYNTKEQEKDGQKSTEKSVAYNEQGSNKNAIVESVEMPKVEGAIVVAKGAESVEMRSKIASAISTVTNLPVYKVQVFEKQG